MKKIPKTVWMLGLVSLFTDLSSEMIYPLLPLFLTTTLGATIIELGFIEGLAEATASIFKMASGIWSDKSTKRKPLIVFGYSVSSIIRPLMGLATSWPVVLILRFTDRLGKGIRTSPRDTLIADVTPADQRGAAYGIHRAMDHAGAVIGPLVATLLLLIPGFTLRQVFLFSIIPAIITILILTLGVKEVPRITPPNQKSSPFLLFNGLKILGPDFKIYLFSLLLFTLGNSTDAFLIMKLSDSGIDAKWIALLWSLHHIVKMVSTYFGGKYSDGKKRKNVIMLSWLYFTFIYILFAVTDSPKILIGIFLLYGGYYGLSEPSERALVVDLVPPELRGTAFGFFHLIVGLGALPASLLFGIIWKTFGAQAAFLTGACLALMASLVLSFLNKKLNSL